MGSVASITNVKKIVERRKEPVIVVVSALGGITDRLIATANKAAAGDETFHDDFEQAMIASVNHCGDSDSTGAVTGNLLGAVIGYEAIPQHFKDDLEFHDVILHVADDLWRGATTKYKL